MDIRQELGKFLTKCDLDFAFSYSRSTKSAPNPALQLAGLGTVGLPLGERDAEAIKSKANVVVSGRRRRTASPKAASSTWEMDAKSIAFKDPKWDSFMLGISMRVSQGLGMSKQDSFRTLYKLEKLIMCGVGSRVSPCADAEKANGAFATIVVTLPSEFTGGATRLSHSGLPVVYDCSQTSLNHTTVIAWYAGVSHEVEPVASGYRLVLVYSLYCAIPGLKPVMKSSEAVVAQLRQILTAWKASLTGTTAAAAQKFVCLLKNRYDYDDIKHGASSLEGRDANVAAILGFLAKDVGLQVGLASASFEITGSVDEDRGWDDWNYGERKPEGMEFDEVESKSLDVGTVVDLDGNKVCEDLKVDLYNEVVPVDFVERVQEGEPEDQDAMDCGGGCGPWRLERWYNVSVLILWSSLDGSGNIMV
ncbi:hypothetical protein BXZ70DRAFT_327606 [Cristinia sonorae]|uniref:Prolyl 4-hydroxylase alpha subunit Fe(2+) 2OG dioxygenase domain-containing protein n=1 Tax=Cristinia sonorae TaxID=1940300 RepID=A0A8K0UL66_9AGAR|nr:hypothetical protein BXZ70DRAFT_327606 [Cristinia sonorae]